MRLAVLDVGSNTVHLVVVDGRPDGSFMVVARERDTLRLAEAAFPSMILPGEAVDRLVASVARMRAYGILKLTLRDSAFESVFLPVNGAPFDPFGAPCH